MDQPFADAVEELLRTYRENGGTYDSAWSAEAYGSDSATVLA